MSKTGDRLLQIARQNPDVTIAGEMPISGAPGGLDSTQGNEVVSQSTNGAESPLERQFADLWQMLGGPELEREHRFEPTRRWRADFAYLGKRKVIIEIEGWGRHQRWQGYHDDIEKYNYATMLGYSLIRLSANMLTPDYVESIIKWIQEESA